MEFNDSKIWEVLFFTAMIAEIGFMKIIFLFQ